MDSPMNSHEVMTEMATKATVGVGGSVYAALQMPLSTYVALATLAYMLCQLIVILPKVIKTIKSHFKKDFTDE